MTFCATDCRFPKTSKMWGLNSHRIPCVEQASTMATRDVGLSRNEYSSFSSYFAPAKLVPWSLKIRIGMLLLAINYSQFGNSHCTTNNPCVCGGSLCLPRQCTWDRWLLCMLLERHRRIHVTPLAMFWKVASVNMDGREQIESIPPCPPFLRY